MKVLPLLLLCAIAAPPVLAEDTRQLDAHEHGVGKLDIAFDGDQIAMALRAPGADIVGFEYKAKSAEDIEAVEDALALLARPLELFVIADAAGCRVEQARAELESEGEHEDHGDDHAHDDHGDDHAHEDHGDEHAHDDHAHDDHAAGTGHTEFHAEYLLTCADPAAVSGITFAYFDMFPNALEVEVQVVSDTGATAFEVERDAPALDLRSLF